LGGDNDPGGRCSLGGIEGCYAHIGFFFILIMEGNVMKHYLLMLVLFAVVSMVGIAPATVLAAKNPTANQVVETIRLNQATAEQLQALPGVGPALSERIIEYRTENGPFSSVDQLTLVKGVGQAKLAKFKQQLTVD
jgi:comEA protein